jgi:class 3 adenylate cyclase
MDIPETRYAPTPLGKIAYQVFGDGPIDVIVEPRSWLPIDLMWDEPRLRRFLERLASFSRQLWFDPRGRGASDPLPGRGRLVEFVVDDIIYLLDHVGWSQAAVMAVARTGTTLLAATHPDRVTALVLVEPTVGTRRTADYPEGWDHDAVERALASIDANWGTGRNLPLYAPALAGDARLSRWLARCERTAMSPAEAKLRFHAAWHVDLRDVLPAITVPTLVVTGDKRARYWSQYVVDHIPHCRQIAGPEPGHLFFTGNTTPMLDGIEEFLTGRHPARDLNRVLATILITDIVESTTTAARLGDHRWLEVLADHDLIIRDELRRFRGTEVTTTGDGFVATFDGPGRAIHAAQAITQAVRPLGVQIRAGLHTGEVERSGHDIGGMAVHIAQRISALAAADEILVSSTVKDLVGGSGIEFTDFGQHHLKGVSDSWHLFRIGR